MINAKQRFLEIYEGSIKREGAKELLNHLESTDFFTAPASTHFHGAHKEGLLIHSVNIYDSIETTVNQETKAIVTLLHDLCKIDCYEVGERNTKNEFGKWITVPFYKWNDKKISYGHGAESVLMIEKFMVLTDEERFAIRYHMGAYEQQDMKALTNVYKKYPLAFELHIADMKATLYLED